MPPFPASNFNSKVGSLYVPDSYQVGFKITQETFEDDLYPGKVFGLDKGWDYDLVSSKSYITEEYFEHDMPILYPDLRKVPSGEYLVEVIFMDYKRSSNENPMVMAEMEILDEGKHRGITIKAYFVVRETGLVGWDNFLHACGFDDVKPTNDFNIKTCTGSRLRVYVNDEGWVRSYQKESDA